MIFRSFSILAVLTFGLCSQEKLDLPVPTCKRNTTDYSSCLKQAIQEAWPLFVKDDLFAMFINEYWPQLYRVAVPLMKDCWDQDITDLLNILFSKISFSAVFP